MYTTAARQRGVEASHRPRYVPCMDCGCKTVTRQPGRTDIRCPECRRIVQAERTRRSRALVERAPAPWRIVYDPCEGGEFPLDAGFSLEDMECMLRFKTIVPGTRLRLTTGQVQRRAGVYVVSKDYELEAV